MKKRVGLGLILLMAFPVWGSVNNQGGLEEGLSSEVISAIKKHTESVSFIEVEYLESEAPFVVISDEGKFGVKKSKTLSDECFVGDGDKVGAVIIWAGLENSQASFGDELWCRVHLLKMDDFYAIEKKEVTLQVALYLWNLGALGLSGVITSFQKDVVEKYSDFPEMLRRLCDSVNVYALREEELSERNLTIKAAKKDKKSKKDKKNQETGKTQEGKVGRIGR